MNTKHLMSRRAMLGIGGAAVLGAAATTFATPQATADPAVLEGGGRSLSLTLASDPSFQGKLANLFPGLLNTQDFEAIAPLACLVSNESSSNVQALSCVWSVVQSGSEFRKPLFFYVRAGRRNRQSAQWRFLAPGQTRIITPYFSWSPQQYKKLASRLDWTRLLSSGSLERFFGQIVSHQSQVNISLDAVIFDDWKSIGPDTAGLGVHIASRRNAEHDQAAVILKLVNANKERSEIVEELRASRSIPFLAGHHVDRGNERGHSYWHWRAIQSQTLLKLAKRLDDQTFSERLIAIRNQKRTSIASLMS